MDWHTLIFAFSVFNLFVFFYSMWQSAFKKNPFGRCHLALLGSFVWGDAVVFSLFWFLLSIIFLVFIPDINFFFFGASLFFTVRGIGETVYWLNQQFSKINRNPPKSFLMERVFPGESVWFAYQIIWQVITVISLILTFYFGVHWVRTS